MEVCGTKLCQADDITRKLSAFANLRQESDLSAKQLVSPALSQSEMSSCTFRATITFAKCRA
jgi:hypothetical protein